MSLYRQSPRIVKLSLLLMAAVMVVYTLVQIPVALYRGGEHWTVFPWGDFWTMVLGTFFITLNVPLSLLVARPIRERRRRWLMIAIWTIFMFGLQLVALRVQIAAQVLFWPDAVRYSFSTLIPMAIVLDSATAVGLLFAVMAIQNHDAAVSAGLRVEQLRALARDEELKALLAQLHPHFLFNTLNAIAALIRIDPEAARSTVGQLRTLIEQHIDWGNAVWTVGDEMHVVTTYLDIERRRFGEQLQILVDVAPDARAVAFPRLLLQPLVENAVRHGARGGGTVSVWIALRDNELRAEVADSGTFIGDGGGTGVGLSNVRARLDLLYGDRHRFDIASGISGTRIQVRIPAE